MRRKTLFYTINLIIPTFLIGCLSICVFYLPCDDSGSGEKITLSLSILFALLVYFLLLTKQLPPTSIVVPLISKYLMFTFIMNMLSVFNTCIVISCYYKQPYINLIHPWIRVFFIELLPKALFMKRPKNYDRNQMFHENGVKENPKSAGNKRQAFRKLSMKFNSYNRFYSSIIRGTEKINSESKSTFSNEGPTYQKSQLAFRNKDPSVLHKINISFSRSSPSIRSKLLKTEMKLNKNNDLLQTINSIRYISHLTNNRRRTEIVSVYYFTNIK